MTLGIDVALAAYSELIGRDKGGTAVGDHNQVHWVYDPQSMNRCNTILTVAEGSRDILTLSVGYVDHRT